MVVGPPAGIEAFLSSLRYVRLPMSVDKARCNAHANYRQFSADYWRLMMVMMAVVALRYVSLLRVLFMVVTLYSLRHRLDFLKTRAMLPRRVIGFVMLALVLTFLGLVASLVFTVLLTSVPLAVHLLLHDPEIDSGEPLSSFPVFSYLQPFFASAMSRIQSFQKHTKD